MVDNVKYLGVQIDRHLSWDKHIHFVRSKVSRAMSYKDMSHGHYVTLILIGSNHLEGKINLV